MSVIIAEGEKSNLSRRASALDISRVYFYLVSHRQVQCILTM